MVATRISKAHSQIMQGCGVVFCGMYVWLSVFCFVWMLQLCHCPVVTRAAFSSSFHSKPPLPGSRLDCACCPKCVKTLLDYYFNSIAKHFYTSLSISGSAKWCKWNGEQILPRHVFTGPCVCDCLPGFAGVQLILVVCLTLCLRLLPLLQLKPRETKCETHPNNLNHF